MQIRTTSLSSSNLARATCDVIGNAQQKEEDSRRSGVAWSRSFKVPLHLQEVEKEVEGTASLTKCVCHVMFVTAVRQCYRSVNLGEPAVLHLDSQSTKVSC
jgi:hypothetical protein